MRKTIGLICTTKRVDAHITKMVTKLILLNCWRRHNFILDDTYFTLGMVRVISQFDSYHPLIVGKNKHPKLSTLRKFYMQADDPQSAIKALANETWWIGEQFTVTGKSFEALQTFDVGKLMKEVAHGTN